MERPKLLATLRRSTRAQQLALERTLGFSGGLASIEASVERLSRCRAVYAPLETQMASLEGWSRYEVRLEVHRQLPHLDADLRALGVREPALIPDCPSAPLPPADPAKALGYLYVLQVVSLEARAMGRRLKYVGGIEAVDGETFPQDYGAQAEEMWRSLDEALERVDNTGTDYDKVVFGAISTFNVFLTCCDSFAQSS